MIVIVDYGMGNLRSVEKGFLKAGVTVKVVSSPQAIREADAIVLPGVGAFRDCMRNLREMSFIEPIVESLQKGKPYLGICLGLQILFTESEEFGKCKGLDILKGSVVKFRLPHQNDLKIPHMGWNSVKMLGKSPLLNGIQDGAYFYFVHSFYVVPEDSTITATITDYGIPFTSMVWKDNIFATQFHPEKSQETGLRILKNFGDFVAKSRAALS
jgi:glutamine amidotransferase